MKPSKILLSVSAVAFAYMVFKRKRRICLK